MPELTEQVVTCPQCQGGRLLTLDALCPRCSGAGNVVTLAPAPDRVATRTRPAPILLTVTARSPAGVAYRASLHARAPGADTSRVTVLAFEPGRYGSGYWYEVVEAAWYAEGSTIDDVPLGADLDADADAALVRLAGEIAKHEIARLA